MLRTKQRRNRQTDRQTDKQTDGQTNRYTYKQTTRENDNDKVSKIYNENIGIETMLHNRNKEICMRYFEPSHRE